jgi:tetratricopeptide (TPR) repeat protein
MKYIEEVRTMHDVEVISDALDKYLKEATSSLKNNQFEEAYKLILKAIMENPNKAEPHNLLGIWYEIKGNNDLARKHYRVAYVLNPTYKPATVNLERAGNLFPYKKIAFDFGEEIQEEMKEEIIDKKKTKYS